MSRKSVTTRTGTTLTLTRVKARNLLARHAYPGRTDSTVGLVYVDADGVAQYGTLWDRADKGGLVFASRSQTKLANSRKSRVDLATAQEEADAALYRVDPDQYVWASTHPDMVALHPDAKWCQGSDGDRSHPAHLKFVKANPSRNPWCNAWAADHRNAEVEEDDTDDEVDSTEEVDTVAEVVAAKAHREALRSDPAYRRTVEAMVRRQQVSA
jgi:hypothetical protein